MTNRILFMRCVVFGVLLSLGISLIASAASTTKPITLTYTNEPLVSVFQRVSEASGFVIVVEGHDKDVSVSGTIENLPLDEAVREILKRFNSAIVWDDSNKAIVISLYAGSPGDTTAGSPVPVRPERQENPDSGEDWFQQALEYTRQQKPIDAAPGGRITGEGRRFIQATPTTEP